MPDARLHENGETCPACELQRAVMDPMSGPQVPCNYCGGIGRVAYSAQQIAHNSAAWARANYWPERLARWGLTN
jgi:hypothetical protein